MATSIPPADSEEPHSQETRLDTLSAQITAIDMLIDLAQQTLLVFDRDLAQGAWNGMQRAERLAAFLRRSRNARLSIIVHDTRFIESSCAGLVDLVRMYGHAMAIWRTGAEAKTASDALVIADARHFLHRYHADRPRATFVTAMPQAAKPLVARFEEIWATGEPAIGSSVLGL